MGGDKIAETVLGMIREVEDNCKAYEEEDTVHFSVYTYLHDHRTISYGLGRGSGHTTAARLLLNDLPGSCIISVKSKDNLEGSRCFTLNEVSGGNVKDTSFQYVIVDNWSMVAPIDRGFIQEFCITQHGLPILILLA